MPLVAVNSRAGVVMGAPGKGHAGLAVPSRPAAHPTLAFTFHGAQLPYSTLGRIWIRAGMAQSHWGTPRAAAAKLVLRRSQSKAGGRERSTSWILGKREQSVPSMAQPLLAAMGDNSRFQIQYRGQTAFSMKLQNGRGQSNPPAVYWDFMAFISALNGMAEPFP